MAMPPKKVFNDLVQSKDWRDRIQCLWKIRMVIEGQIQIMGCSSWNFPKINATFTP